MTIYTLEQLRNTAPIALKNLPDDVLICHYMKSVGGDQDAFQYFGVEKPLIFSCETLVDLYDVYLPANGLVSGAVAAAGFAAAIILYKFFANRSKNVQHGAAIKLAAMAGAFSILIGTASLFRYNVITALSIFLVWSVVTVPTFFAVGYVFRAFKSGGFSGLLKKIRGQLIQEKKLRDSPAIWLQVSNEIEAGSIDKALWAQCLAQAGGDEAKTKSDYMIKRYDQLSLVNP